MYAFNPTGKVIFGIITIMSGIMLADGANEHNVQQSFAQNTGPESPKKQVETGVMPEDILCKNEYVLAIRTNGSPTCTTMNTAEILIQRGIVDRIIGHTSENAAIKTDLSAELQEEQVRIGSGQDNRMDNGQDNQTTTNTNTTAAQSTATAAQLTQKYESHSGSVTTIPASTMSVVNFYVTDHDLNTSPSAPEIIPVGGLLAFTINGISIDGPKTMTETGPNTGQFYVRLELPAAIDGRPLNQNDIVDVTYLDQTDYSGKQQAIKKSFTLSSTYAQMQTEGDGRKRIGHEFRLAIYEPDANRDSREEDRIPLSMFEFKSEGNVRATLDHHAFDANKSHMIETGPNTGIFDIVIKIPRQIDGKIINIGDWYEITYNDYSTPSGTSEEIVLRGKIGL